MIPLEFGQIYERLRTILPKRPVGSKPNGPAIIEGTIPPSKTTPATDYRSSIVDYLFQLITEESSFVGKNPDDIAAALQTNPIMKGVWPRKIRGVIGHTLRTGSTDLLKELAIRDLPPNPNYQVRRILKLWHEQSTRPTAESADPLENKLPKRNGHSNQNLPSPTTKDTAKVEVEKTTYTVGRLYRKPLDWQGIRYGVEELSEDRLTDFIEQRANKIAHRDLSLVAACQEMVSMVRENPTTSKNNAVARMSMGSMAIEGTSYPLFRFSPHEVPGLNLPHPLADRLRIVYAIYREGGRKIVVLDGEGIYTHHDYEKRYKLARR